MKSTKGSTSNAQAVVGEKGQEGKPKDKKNHKKKELEKLDNATNDETYHVLKKGHHIWHTGHQDAPCSCC